MGGPASADSVFITALSLFQPLPLQQEQIGFVDRLLCKKALALITRVFVGLTWQLSIFSVEGRLLDLFSSHISCITLFQECQILSRLFERIEQPETG